jgi:hypothetical protein
VKEKPLLAPKENVLLVPNRTDNQRNKAQLRIVTASTGRPGSLLTFAAITAVTAAALRVTSH